MTNSNESPINSEFQQEIIEILNKNELLCSFNEVFQKYGLSANNKITINFIFSDITPPQTRESFQADEALLPLLAQNRQFQTTWCPAPLCPPPGRWVG